jgi:hypothetical protein
MAIMAIGGEIYDPCLLDMVKGLKETTPPGQCKGRVWPPPTLSSWRPTVLTASTSSSASLKLFKSLCLIVSVHQPHVKFSFSFYIKCNNDGSKIKLLVFGAHD